MIELMKEAYDSEEAFVGYFTQKLLSGDEDDTTYLVSQILPEMILNPKLRAIYRAGVKFIGRPIALGELVSASNVGIDLVKSVISKTTVSINIDPYMRHIKETHNKSRLVGLAETLKQNVSRNTKLDDIIQEASDVLADIEFAKSEQDDKAEDTIIEVISQLEEAKEGGYDPDKYVDTGIETLDNALGGVEGGWLLLIGARPGMGKTQLSLMMARNMAQRSKPVLFFSLEMSKTELVRRLVLENAHISPSEAKHGWFDNEQLKRAHENASKLYSMPLYIDDTGGATVGYMDNIIRKHIAMYGIRAVVIDYIQLIGGYEKESAYERMSRIALELKNIAKKRNIAVFALSQLNRLNEQRKDKRPNMSELRDSGALEQNADVIMLLYRDGYYTQDVSNNTLEVNVAKHRHGASQTVSLYYNPAWGTIKDLEGRK